MTTDRLRPRRVLSDHIVKKRRLVPPLLHVLGDRYAPYSWSNQLVPETIWISLIQDFYGLPRGVDLCRKFVLAVVKVYPVDEVSPFVTLSSFLRLSPAQKKTIVKNCAPSLLFELRRSLAPMSLICNWHPLDFLFSDYNITESVNFAKVAQILQNLYDRQSREAVLTMATCQHLVIIQGKLTVSPHLAKKLQDDFEAIENYPNTESSRRAAGGFRAAAPMLLVSESGKIDTRSDEWLAHFWESVGGIGECINEAPLDFNEPNVEDQLGSAIFGYRRLVKGELKARLDKFSFDLMLNEKHEVIGALLSRQVGLCIEFLCAPPVWTANTAPLILRAMADVFISFAWIIEDPEPRAKKFIEHGLGEAKLEAAHRTAALQVMDDKDEREIQSRMIEYKQAWIETHKIDAFVEVNLGSWSGLTTRKMAEEAGLLDFYNNVYQPFSACVHSSWSHVGDKNVVFCGNPAHRYHRIPTILEFAPEPDFAYLATKYVNKTFKHFDKWQMFESDLPSAFEFFVGQLEKIYGDSNEKE